MIVCYDRDINFVLASDYQDMIYNSAEGLLNHVVNPRF